MSEAEISDFVHEAQKHTAAGSRHDPFLEWRWQASKARFGSPANSRSARQPRPVNVPGYWATRPRSVR
jgi:hypothetical protein